MSGHVYFKCGPGCAGCQFCDGGLAHCVRCDCGEGTLPTDCPGEVVDAARQAEIYRGHVDFRDGRWVTPDGSGRSKGDVERGPS